jgi:uncharacterized protein YqhQ
MSETKPFNYGGQAVIEGVMMRGSKLLAVAVRNPENDIVVHVEPLDARIYGGRLIKTPFLRGLVLLWDALGLGIKSLMFAADVALEEEGDGNGDEPGQAFSTPVQVGTILLSLAMAIGLFFVLPAILGGLLQEWLNTPYAAFISHIVEGAIRLSLLIGYIWGIGQLEDVKRLYGYHGAEHKTINAYEAGAELTPPIVAEYPIEHPRCGTAFLLTVVVFSIILFTLIPSSWVIHDSAAGAIATRIITRIMLIPVVAGFAYEYIRWTANHLDSRVVQGLIKPNLWLQHLTTRNPDDSMLEVAIAAFKQVRLAEDPAEPLESKTFTLFQQTPEPAVE